MPIGAFRLNSIAKYLAPSAPPARTALTWTAVGNAQIDTAQSKFDGSSALFDANGDYLSNSGNNAIWSYDANQDFTWEMWWRSPTSTAFNGALFNNPGAMMLYVTTDAGNWKYAVWNGAGNNYVVSSALTITANTWYHVAFTRSGGDMKLWHNGTQVGSASGLSGAIPSSNGALIGMYSNTFYMNGWIDELRISKGIARYTTTFTPSTTSFTNDQYTSTLLHFTAPDASTIFVDDATASLVSATGGAETAVTISGTNYKVHTFTSSGTFIVSGGGNVEILLVGGGAAGYGSNANYHTGGGGGGGQVRNLSNILTTAQAYTITVGATQSTNGNNGNPSIALGNTSQGGNGYNGGNSNTSAGGYGGGGDTSSGSAITRGTGTQNGGTGIADSITYMAYGGGGGSNAAVGGNATHTNGTTTGTGGAGATGVAVTDFSSTGTIYYGAGGGGGIESSSGSGGTGGTGGGGNGGKFNGATPTAGTANTGSGGGGMGRNNGAAGGSGIVIIRYPV